MNKLTKILAVTVTVAEAALTVIKIGKNID